MPEAEQIPNALPDASVQADEYASFTLDAQGCVSDWPQSAERMLGHAEKEIVGRHFAHLFPAEVGHRGTPERNLRVAAKEGRTGVRAHLARRDGSAFQANVIITALRGDRPPGGGYAILVLDVSSLKSAQPVFYEAYEHLVRRIEERSKRLETAVATLRASERRLALALEAGEVGYWEMDLNSGQVARDKRIAAMLGYAAGELGQTRQAWEALIHPEDLPGFRAAWHALGSGSQLVESEQRMRSKTGQWRWVLTRGRVVERDATGAPLKAAGVHEDISAMKLRDLAHVEAEQRLRLAMEGARLGSWDWEVAANKITWAGLAGQILGIGDDRLPRTLDEIARIVHPDDRSSFREKLIGALKQGSTFDFTLRLFPTERGERWLSSWGQVRRDAAGRAERLTAVFHDITARRLAERALLDSERRFRKLATAAPLGIFQADADGNYVFVNEHWCAYAGVSAAQAIGQPWSFVLHPDDRPRVVGELSLALSQRRDLISDCRFATPEGKVTRVRLRLACLHKESGEPEGYVGTVGETAVLAESPAGTRSGLHG